MSLKKVDTMPDPHLIVSTVEGWDGAGKTRFGLTAPAPVGFINFDRGLDGVIQEFAGKKDIRLASYPFRKGEASADQKAVDLWDQAERDIHTAIDTCASVVIDEQMALWELIRMAQLGKLEKVKSREYGPANRAMDDIFNHAFDAKTHLMVLARPKEKYVGDKPTGELMPKGWPESQFKARQRIFLSHLGGLEFEGEVLKARGNPKLVGTVLENPDFISYALAVYPDADEEEFE